MEVVPNMLERRPVMVTPDNRLSRKDAAAFLGYQPKTLSEWARLGKGPKGRKVGGRVFYMLDDLRAFVGGHA
jgi:hypothetical protein